MKILITGGAGFLGQRLARELLAHGKVGGQAFTTLTLLDVVPAPDFGDTRIRVRVGDLSQPEIVDQAIDAQTAVVFHLAAIVSGQAEADFDLGMRINLDASRNLLEACRRRGHVPRVVFTSSVAVYGGDLPDVVRDDTALDPRSSYGVQKAVAELLLSDYARKGFVDGVVLRLPTISVRPGKPNAAASSFASGIIREPLKGETAVCPVSGHTRLWLLSPRNAIACLIRAAEIDTTALGGRRIVNLPGLSVSVDEMLVALRQVAGDTVADRVTWQPDPRVESIVGSWPGRWDTARAERLGFPADRTFAEVIQSHIDEELGSGSKPPA